MMRTYQRTEVSDPAVGLVEPAEVEVTESEYRFSPSQVVHAAIGVFLVVVGIVAMVRGDLGDLTDSQFAILGITHNAAIGLGELIAGALLLLAAASPGGRFLGLIVGLAMIVFGAVLLGDEQTMRDVGTEDAWPGWRSSSVPAPSCPADSRPPHRRRPVDRP